MGITKFEDILAWQRAKQFNLSAYEAFRSCKDYYFKDQILRATLSIMNNIAEGFGRQTNKEFRQFLFISRGSCNEVKSMLYLATEFNHINQTDFSALYNSCDEILRLLHGLINSIKCD